MMPLDSRILGGLFLLALSFVVFSVDSLSSLAGEVPLHNDSVVKFASVEQSRDVLQRRDRFVMAQSPFDRQARLKTDRQVSIEEYLRFVSAHIIAWDRSDEETISKVITRLSKKLAPWKLKFPAEVLLVQTTGEEEGNAAYCRGNAIILPKSKISLPAQNFERLLTHELFHILSNHNPDLRRQLYATIGFRPCPEIPLPKSLAPRKITNPDAPGIDYFIELMIEDRPVKAVPILFSKTERYDASKGGSFFRYLQFRLLAVRQQGETWTVVEKQGRPVLFNPSKVASFHEQIGANTKYIIHPDEILADNFMHLIHQKKDLPTPRILKELERHLRR